MAEPTRILLQTTIASTEDDWHIGRFSMLRQHLQELVDEDGFPLYEVVARDRAPIGFPDPVLSNLRCYEFDQLWLFAVDPGDGLEPEDCAGIAQFRRDGGGLLISRDHMDLGCSVCGIDEVGAAHFFHSHNPSPDRSRRTRDDSDNLAISWPNYHSGANGDFQEIRVEGAPHPILRDPSSPTGLIRFLPSHPHEGAVGAPPGNPGVRVIATGTSKATGAAFNIAVAFEPSPGIGPAIAQSTFHHFADFNWDPTHGCPTFVLERPGGGLARSRAAQASVRRYVTNIACWLAARAPLDLPRVDRD